MVVHAFLGKLLTDSARWHARTAVTGFVAEDLDDLLQAAVSTGSAVELIAKALLATVSPALLADNGQPDSLLMLTGNKFRSDRTATQLRSIAAQQATRLAKKLFKELPVDVSDDPLPFRVRNAATHMALVNARELHAAVLQMVKLVDAALPLLDLDKEAFWGPNATVLVPVLLDEARTEMVRTLQAKMTAAQQYLARLLAGVPEAERPVVLLALSNAPLPDARHHEPRECPACAQTGSILCSVDRGSLEVDYDDPNNGLPSIERWGIPSSFFCPVCHFSLEREELEEFCFSSEVELEPDYDPVELEWEPAEDYYRDR